MRKILYVNTGEIFPNLMSVCKGLEIPVKSICRSLNGKLRLGSGHCFILLKDAILFEEKHNRKIEISDFKTVYHFTKPVLCVELNKIFNSIKEASDSLKIHSNNIIAACKGRLKTAGKYHWIYLSDAERFEEENGKQVTVDDFAKSCRLEPVFCVELKRKFSSIAEASKETNINYRSILDAVKGRMRTAGKYHWVYLSDAEKFEKENGRPITPNDFKKICSWGKPIFCVELNRVFPSIKEASEKLGIAYTSIVDACRKNKLTAGKYHWIYLNDAEQFKLENGRPITVDDFQKSNHLKPVFCLELQKEFSSVKEAYMRTGVYCENIVAVCKGRGKTAGGYHWAYTKDIEKFKKENGREMIVEDFNAHSCSEKSSLCKVK